MRSLPSRSARATATDDELLRFLGLVAGTTLGLAPWRHRMAATGGLAFATTEGMVERVHGNAAGLRSLALPPVAARLADLDELGFGVADFAHGAPAVDGHPAHLGAGQAQRGVVAFLGHELNAHACTARHLAALTGLELHVVHGGTDGDVAQWQGIAGPDVGALTALQQVAHLH